MNKDVKFRRNVYIILVCILLLAIASQVARTEFVLELNNGHLKQEMNKLRSLSDNSLILTEQDFELQPMHCVYYDAEDELSMDIKNNVIEVYRYLKQPYSLQELSQNPHSFEGCSAVLMTAGIEHFQDDITKLDAEDISELDQYVQNGGYIFLMRMDPPNDVLNQIYRKLGMINFTFIEGNRGIELTSNVLIKQKDLKLGEDFIYNDSLTLELDNNAEVLARGLNRMPLLWKNNYGDGAFMVYNGNNLHYKSNRGLIVGGLSMLIPDYIYPIFNSKVFYIDDFPAPLRQGTASVIYEEYGMDTPNFFQKIWWPDMIKLAQRYNLKYTAVAIQTYEDDIEPPFSHLGEEELFRAISFGREVIKGGGEVGIHGYNHQSLQMSKYVGDQFGYIPWKSQEDMEASIEEVLEYLSKGFPNYVPMSYVPPSNVLSEEGRQALISAWPDLAVIASVYDVDPTNLAYVQEYEIADDGVIEMPRVTSGYFGIPYMKWLEANALTSLGVISHFIHPDDILSEDRGKSQKWSDLYESLDSMLQNMNDSYPWIRSMIATEAGLDMARVLHNQMARDYKDNQLTVKTSDSFTQHYILRTDKKIGRQENCLVKKIDDNTYLVTAMDSQFTIELGR